MITSIDKVHLKCDCVDGSIVNGVREQILYSFNPPGYKVMKEPTTVLYKKKQNTIRQHPIFPRRLESKRSRFQQLDTHLHDSNH